MSAEWAAAGPAGPAAASRRSSEVSAYEECMDETGGVEYRRPGDPLVFFKPPRLEQAWPPSATNWLPRCLSAYQQPGGKVELRLRAADGTENTQGLWAFPLNSGVGCMRCHVHHSEALEFPDPTGRGTQRHGAIGFTVGSDGGPDGNKVVWTFAAQSEQQAEAWLQWLNRLLGVPIIGRRPPGGPASPRAPRAASPPPAARAPAPAPQPTHHPHHPHGGMNGGTRYPFTLSHRKEDLGLIYIVYERGRDRGTLILAAAAAALARAGVPTPSELLGFCGAPMPDAAALRRGVAAWRRARREDGDVVLAPLDAEAERWFRDQHKGQQHPPRRVDGSPRPRSTTSPPRSPRSGGAAPAAPAAADVQARRMVHTARPGEIIAPRGGAAPRPPLFTPADRPPPPPRRASPIPERYPVSTPRADTRSVSPPPPRGGQPPAPAQRAHVAVSALQQPPPRGSVSPPRTRSTPAGSSYYGDTTAHTPRRSRAWYHDNPDPPAHPQHALACGPAIPVAHAFQPNHHQQPQPMRSLPASYI